MSLPAESSPVVTKTDLLYRSADELRAIQNRNFRRQMELCFAAHPYYREVLSQHGLTLDDFHTVDDIVKLPFTAKQDYMRNPMAFRLDPLPELTLHERVLWDVTYTTGTTTGQPTPFFNTTYDYFATMEGLRRLCGICGITQDDVVMNLFPLTPVPHIGFLRTRDYATVIGAAVINCLTGTPHPQFPIHRRLDDAVAMIERHRGTVLSGIVSYVRRVVMRAEELGADFSAVRLVLCLGEPCPRGMRDDIRQRLVRLGADTDNVMVGNALGFTEMQSSTVECAEFSGGHNPSPDLYYFEVVDERTYEPLPDGERGLFVVTHLNRRGTVLLRYVLGDITALSHEPCSYCGRGGVRVVGNTVRTGELLKVRGTLINPDVIKEAIATVSGIDEYQIVFTKEHPDDPYSEDKLVVRVAVAPERRREVTERLVPVVHAAAEMRPVIEFAEMSEIFDPTQSLKSTRVVDRRPKVE